MKVCPICQSTYEDAVDFCFKDGAPLDSQDAPASAEDEDQYALAGITADDLEPPDAISLSNIPAVEPDEDAITQTLPLDLPEAEELDRSYDRLEAVEGPPESDVTGIVDPFGGHEEEKFRARLAGDGPEEGPDDLPEPGGLPDPTGLPDGADLPDDPEEDETADAADLPEAGVGVPVVDDEDDADEDEDEDEAPVVAPIPPPPSTAPKPAPKPKPKPKRGPASPRSAMPGGKPRRRPQDFGQPQEKDRRGLIIFLIALIVIVLLIGWQLTKGPGDDGRIADADPTPTATAVATPAPTPEPTPEQVAEETPEGETPGEDVTDGLAEGETPEQIEEPTPEDLVEPPAVETDAERRRREDRERRRREREEERRRLEESRATPAPTAAPEPTPQPTGAPEPPFSTGGSEPTPRPTVAPSDNPWAASGTPAPPPTPDPANPWGTAVPSAVDVTISSQPGGARVSVGGRYRGTSPVTLSLDPGTHEVRVEQQGFATQTRYLKVEGTRAVGLDVVLESLTRVASGTLVVASAPPATLYVDGVSKGRTPLSVAITAGTHQFKLETDDGRVLNQTLNIEVTEGGTVNKFFQIPE